MSILKQLGQRFNQYVTNLEQAKELLQSDEVNVKKLRKLTALLEQDTTSRSLLDKNNQSVLEQILQYQPTYSGLKVEEQSAEGKKTQDEWITYWNKEGRGMASQPDTYQFFKDIKEEFEHGNRNLAERLIKSLHEDFDWPSKSNWLITSTKPVYETDGSLDATIIHHYKSEIITPEATKLIIPVYRGIPIEKVAAESEGLNHLQVSNGTEDSGEEIIKTLEFISGKDRSKIKVWTAATSGNYTRKSHPKRAAGFGFNNGGFHISSSNIDSQGRSRGVSYTP